MRKIKVNAETTDRLKKAIVQFIIKYGDDHITTKAIKWLKNTSFSQIAKENGHLIHVVLGKKNNILAVIAVARYGLDQAIIVVHPRIRKSGIAFKLTSGVLEDIDRMYVKVANDNIPSLKLCFAVGMNAFHLTKGPTGKPTLVLGLGNWKKSEWDNYSKTNKK